MIEEPKISWVEPNGLPIFSITSGGGEYFYMGCNCRHLNFTMEEAGRIIDECNPTSQELDTFFEGYHNSPYVRKQNANV